MAIVGKSHSVSGGDSGIPADQVTPIKGVGRKPSVDYIAWADIDGMLQREKGATIHQLGEVRCVGVANTVGEFAVEPHVVSMHEPSALNGPLHGAIQVG